MRLLAGGSLLICILFGASCGLIRVDPCAGLSGTCLALQVDSAGARMVVDQLQVHVHSPDFDQQRTTIPLAHQAEPLPLAMALQFPRLAAGMSELMDIDVAAQLGTTSVGHGTLRVTVQGGTHASATVLLDGGAPPLAALTIAQAADCGATLLGTTAGANVTVTNNGQTAAGAIMISTGDAQFVAGGCTSTLAPHASCTLAVQFTPTHSGAQSTWLTASATPGSSATTTVSGVGLSPAALAIAPPNQDFGSASRNSAGNLVAFTATNSGDVASDPLKPASFSGGDAASFFIPPHGDGCNGQVIAPHASCTVQVQLKPVRSGTLGAIVQLRDANRVLGSAPLMATGTPIWVQEMPVAQLPALNVLFGSDAGHVYAAGGANFYARDGSGTWTSYPVTAAVVPMRINQGWAGAPNDIWLATDVGLMRSTSPGNWSVDNSSGAVALTGIHGFGADDVWIATSGATLYHLSGGTWSKETPMSMATNVGPIRLWGSSDNDLWAFGRAHYNGVVTAIAFHRGANGVWSNEPVGAGFNIGPGNHQPYAWDMIGFGSLSSTALFAAVEGYGPMFSAGNGDWSRVPYAPLGCVGGTGVSYAVWGTSPTNLWFACSQGIYHYTGNGNWDTNAELPVANMGAVWGSSGLDVYALGADSTGGFIYHYY